MGRMKYYFLTLILFLAAGLCPAADEQNILSTLEKKHPRLILKNHRLEELKSLAKTDTTLQKYVNDSIKRADGFLDDPLLERELIGPRLLYVSRRCLNRVYALAFAYRWTGEKKYADKAIENVLAVCEFSDWNPSHFLDVAEMSHAVAVGYDWLYDYMDQPTRDKIRAGLVKHGLKAGLQQYGKKRWWCNCEHNWNQVCNSGLIVASLAIADEEPDLAAKITSTAVANLPIALKTYGPDGAWPEGPGYWRYATEYTCFGLSALQTALGKDFALDELPGMSKAGYAPIYMAGPTGLYLNFADSGEKQTHRPNPCMFFLARNYSNPIFADDTHTLLKSRSAGPLYVAWYVPPSKTPQLPSELDRFFGGPVQVATFRSSWTDPNALFLGIKAGYNQVNHGHLDLGNFELDALGVRWARDLGSDDYNLENYWKKQKGGQRWKYYRLNSLSHSVPLINGQSQDEMAASKIIKYRSEKSFAFALIDITAAYAQFAQKVTRGGALISNRREFLIQDEFVLKAPARVTWAMTTDAGIFAEKQTAILSLQGKQLLATILSPEGAVFTIESAEQKPPEKPNTGVKRLLIDIPDAEGKVTIAVLLAPFTQNAQHLAVPAVKPLIQW